MRSLYALHPETVLQLHERGAVLYGQPLTLSLPEAEERLIEQEYPRVVVDPQLCRTQDERRVLRRISALHPGCEIAFVRSGVSRRGMPLDALARELRGDIAPQAPRCAVVVSLKGAEAGAYCALAVSAHLAGARPTLLLETDTVDPVIARRMRLRPTLAAFLLGAPNAPQRRAGWPRELLVVAAPQQPELLLEWGMEPLAERVRAIAQREDVVVRASANLADRGLLALLPLATDVLVCAEAADGQYSRWVRQLAPRARVRTLPVRRGALRPARAGVAGAALWEEGSADAD